MSELSSEQQWETSGVPFNSAACEADKEVTISGKDLLAHHKKMYPIIKRTKQEYGYFHLEEELDDPKLKPALKLAIELAKNTPCMEDPSDEYVLFDWFVEDIFQKVVVAIGKSDRS